MGTVQLLIDDLKNFKTRSLARHKLIELGADEAGEKLLAALSGDCADNVIWASIDIFGAWRWKGAVDQLLLLLETKLTLQTDILRSLKFITGYELEADAALWRRMLENPSVFMDLQKVFTSDEILDFQINESFCSIVLPLPRSRRQEVLIYEKESSLTLYTECGEIDISQKGLVEKFNLDLSWAELLVQEVDGLIKVTLTAEVAQDNIQAATLKSSIIKMAELADSLEEQLTGKDKV